MYRSLCSTFCYKYRHLPELLCLQLLNLRRNKICSWKGRHRSKNKTAHLWPFWLLCSIPFHCFNSDSTTKRCRYSIPLHSDRSVKDSLFFNYEQTTLLQAISFFWVLTKQWDLFDSWTGGISCSLERKIGRCDKCIQMLHCHLGALLLLATRLS